MSEPIPQTVSQEAREAAISFAVDRGWWSPPFVEMIRSGGLDCNGVVQAFAAFEAQIRADCAARFVEKVEWLPMSDAPRGRKVLIYSQRWGVTEGLQFDSGKWGIGTFNGQCIAVEPLCWTTHPAAPSDEAITAIQEPRP